MTTLPLIREQGRVAIDRATLGLAPLPVSHILCVGRNYADHAKEMKADLPERPMLFTKNPASAILSAEPIVIPKICQDRDQVDYEGELAIVIGRTCKDVPESEALDPTGPVLGLTIANDILRKMVAKRRCRRPVRPWQILRHLLPPRPPHHSARPNPRPPIPHTSQQHSIANKSSTPPPPT